MLYLINQSCKNLYRTHVLNKKNNVLILERKNLFIHVWIRYIRIKVYDYYLLLCVDTSGRCPLLAKCHLCFFTVDQVSVANSCYTANTHFPSRYVWEWGGGTLSLLSQCLANIRNWRPAKINNVQEKKRQRRRSVHISYLAQGYVH